MNWDSMGLFGAPSQLDPPDTTNATFEAQGGNAINILSGIRGMQTVTSLSAGLPQGVGPPEFVLQWKFGASTNSTGQCPTTSDTCTHGSIRDHLEVKDVTDCTWCLGGYLIYSDNITNVDSQNDIKGIRIQQEEGADPFTPNYGATLEFRGSMPGGMLVLDLLSHNKDPSGAFDFPTSTAPDLGPDVINLDSCSDQGWCQVQMCFDHNWDTFDKMRVRGMGRALEGTAAGDVQVFSIDSDADHPIVHNGDGQRNPYRFTVDRQSVTGHYSHFESHTVCPADPDYWIPPAVEIEGGSVLIDPTKGGTVGGGSLTMLRRILPTIFRTELTLGGR